MELKPYAGQDVWIQFVMGQPWLALAATKEGLLAIDSMPHPQTGEGDIVPLPAINAHISDDGQEAIIKKKGGVIAIRFSPEVIHSVTRVVSAPSSIIQVASPLQP